MNFLIKNKTAAMGAVILVILVWAYFTYFSGSSTSSGTLTTTSDQTVVSQQLLQALQNLHTIKLDGSIFTDPVFTSLTDFGVTIPPEDAGRPDPFLPLTGLVTSSSAAGGVPASPSLMLPGSGK